MGKLRSNAGEEYSEECSQRPSAYPLKWQDASVFFACGLGEELQHQAGKSLRIFNIERVTVVRNFLIARIGEERGEMAGTLFR